MSRLEKLETLVTFIFIGSLFLAIVFNFEKIVNGIRERVDEAFQPMYEELEKHERERQQEINQCIEEEYIVYLDGQEVDIRKIDISLYSYSINHEEKVVYVTQKQQTNTNRTSFLPFFWLLR